MWLAASRYDAAMTRSGWVPLITAVLVALALVLVSSPVGLFSGSEVIGRGTADTWGHIWGYWWAWEAVSGGAFPYDAAPLNAPEGMRWWLIDYPVALALLPVTAVFGPVAAYHVALVGQAALCGAALAWWLQRHDVAPVLASGAGVLLGLSPFVRGVVASGVPEVLSIAVIPLFAVALQQGLAGGRRALVVSCLCCVWLAANGVYGLLAGSLVGAVLLVRALRDSSWRALARAAAPVLAVAVPLAVTFWGLSVMEHPAMDAAPAARGVPNRPLQWITAPLKGADLVPIFVPGFVLPEPAIHPLHRHTTYLGWLLLIAAGLAARKRGLGRFLFGMGCASVVLALGPWLTVAGTRLIPMPGFLLDVVGVHHLYRLIGLATFCFVGAAALHWQAMSRRGPALVWMGLALGEGLVAPVLEVGPSVELPVGRFERWLRDEAPPGAIVDLPFERDGFWPRGPWPQRSLVVQTVHGRPIASRLYGDPAVIAQLAPMDDLHAFALEAWRDDKQYAKPWDTLRPVRVRPRAECPPLRRRPPAELQAARGELRALGFSVVTVQLASYPEACREPLIRHLTSWLGEPVLRIGTRWAWQIDAP